MFLNTSPAHGFLSGLRTDFTRAFSRYTNHFSRDESRRRLFMGEDHPEAVQLMKVVPLQHGCESRDNSYFIKSVNGTKWKTKES